MKPTKTYRLSQVKQTENDWDGSYSPDIELYRCGCAECLRKQDDVTSKQSVFAPLDFGEFSGRAVLIESGNVFRQEWTIVFPMFSTSVFVAESCTNTGCDGSYYEVELEEWPADIALQATLAEMAAGYETFDAAVKALSEFVEIVHAVYELDAVGKQMLLVSLEDGVLLPEAVQLGKAVML